MIGGPFAASRIFGRGGGEEGEIVERQYVWVLIDEFAFLVWNFKSEIIWRCKSSQS